VPDNLSNDLLYALLLPGAKFFLTQRRNARQENPGSTESGITNSQIPYENNRERSKIHSEMLCVILI
jgi:hypothetical protein